MLDEAQIEARQRRREESRRRLGEAIERASAPKGIAPPAGVSAGTLNNEGVYAKGKPIVAKTPEQIKSGAAASAEAFEKSKSKLFRSDGTQLYGPEEHKERLGEITRERDARLDSLIEEAASERVKAEAAVEELKDPDLTARLTPDELAAANSRYTFISEEVSELGKDRLLSRLDRVLESGDRASMFAHARAVRKRAAAEYEKRVAAAGKAGRGAAYATRSSDLTGAAEQLEDRLMGGSREEKAEAAEARAKEYMGAEYHVGMKRRPYRPNYSRPGGVPSDSIAG